MIQVARDRVNDADAIVIHSDDLDEMSSFLQALHWHRLTWTELYNDFTLSAPYGAKVITHPINRFADMMLQFAMTPDQMLEHMQLAHSSIGISTCTWRCFNFKGEGRTLKVNDPADQQKYIFTDWLTFTGTSEEPMPGYFKLKYDTEKQSLFALASPSWSDWDIFTNEIDRILSLIEHEFE